MPKVEIYSYKVCPYCVRAKFLFQQKGVEFKELRIDLDPSLAIKMQEMTGLVQRMRELSVQAANEGTMDTTERGYLDQEFQLLESELDRIVKVTEFNGSKLIDGTLSAGTNFQVGYKNTGNDRISF